MNLINGSKFLDNIIKLVFILFLTYGCSSLPGINEEPEKQTGSKINLESYSVNDIKIDIINLNELTEIQIKKYNNSKVKEIKYSIKKFSNIYLISRILLN